MGSGSRIALHALAALTVTVAMPAAAHTGLGVHVATTRLVGPAVAIVEPVRARPAWVPGHWEWQGDGHAWVPGHYNLPRRAYAWRDEGLTSAAPAPAGEATRY